jgi:hypothetical protein
VERRTEKTRRRRRRKRKRKTLLSQRIKIAEGQREIVNANGRHVPVFSPLRVQAVKKTTIIIVIKLTMNLIFSS